MSSDTYTSGRLFSCDGLIAVVTGGGSGLGAVMAEALARNGAKVFILGRRLAKLQEVAKKAQDGKIIPVECDASSKEALEAAAKRIEADAGHINLLCINHGIAGPNNRNLARTPDQPALSIKEAQQTLWSTSMDDFLSTYQVNVASHHFTAVAFLHLLDAGNKAGNVKQRSQIILTSSIGGLHRSWTQSGIAYNTSKAAATHLGKSLAAFLIQWEIRVNVLAPGIFPSEMTDGVFGGGNPRAEGYLPKTMQPMTRTGREEEFAGTVLYMASEAGGYLSGSVQLIDGGRLGVLAGATY